MKIALFTPYAAPEPTGGVKIQGLMWKDGLEKIGDTVDLINFWDNIDWKSYDAVVSLGYGGSFRVLSKSLTDSCKKLALAPIIDPTWNKSVYKFIAKYWGSQKYLGLSSRFHDLYLGSRYYDVFLVRSEFERNYVNKCLDIPLDKIKIVPLSIRTPFIDYFPEKENFCFHSSRLAAKNKM